MCSSCCGGVWGFLPRLGPEFWLANGLQYSAVVIGHGLISPVLLLSADVMGS